MGKVRLQQTPIEFVLHIQILLQIQPVRFKAMSVGRLNWAHVPNGFELLHCDWLMR